MTKKQKKNLTRIIVSAVITLGLGFMPVSGILRFVLYMVPYFIVGYDILRKAFLGIVRRQIFDENFLMAIATLGAILIALNGKGDYTEAVAVMLFYQTGEWFQSYAVGKSRRSISDLMDIRSDYANIEVDGELMQIDPELVKPGSVITVCPGEKVAIDGVVISGNSAVDTSKLTGESLPRDVKCGDEIISGCINLTGVLHIRTTKEFSESTVSKILDMVENASSRKSRSEAFISRFARIYTPAVCFSALAIAIFPPLLGMLTGYYDTMWAQWFYRALTFLVVSCPCALVISIPLSFFAGLGCAGREGVLIKGSNYLEALSGVDTMVFDKTGTLTMGSFTVVGVYGNTIAEKDLIGYAAKAECYSLHPVAVSLRDAWGKTIDSAEVTDVTEKSGKGVVATVSGRRVAVGNSALMEENGVEYVAPLDAGTAVYVAIDSLYAGCILIADMLKSTSAQTLSELKNLGIRKTVMLTGDSASVAEAVGAELNIDEVYPELLPGDKVEKVEHILNTGAKVAFVGDGINDAPVLSRADIGIAMGAFGSDAAIEAADVVLMDDNPYKIVRAVKISGKCIGIVYQNCIFAIGIKLICLFLAAVGFANMWLAIFADVGVMVLAVLNALRVMKCK